MSYRLDPDTGQYVEDSATASAHGQTVKTGYLQDEDGTWFNSKTGERGLSGQGTSVWVPDPLQRQQWMNKITGELKSTPDGSNPGMTEDNRPATPTEGALGAGEDKHGPVLQPGTKIPGADFDITQPGDREKFFKETKSIYTDPSREDKFATGLTDRFGESGEFLPGTTNRADEVYQDYKSGPTKAGLSPYYDNAKRVAGEDIDKRLSARGMYGSSAADNAIQEAMTNLSAEEANRTADFDLRRLATGSGLASSADSDERAGNADERAGLDAFGRAMHSADTSDINRTVAGQNAAGSSDAGKMDRVRTGIDSEFTMGDRISGILGSGWKTMVDTDSGVQDNAITTGLGAHANDVNAKTATANANNTGTREAIDTGVATAGVTLPLLNKPKTAGGGGGPDPVAQSQIYSAQYPGASSEPWNQY